MKENDFVEIEYVGKIKESGEIFDITDENMAKEKKIFNPGIVYGPITVVVGARQVLPGLDKALLGMAAGEKKTIIIECKDAFGERKAALTKIVPMSQFKKQNINPHQGQYLTFDEGLKGRVLSVSGGRVRLDFNHPLAGKALSYEITLKRKVDDIKEKVAALVAFYLGAISRDAKISVEGEKAQISIPEKIPVNDIVKRKLTEVIKKYVPEVKAVDF